jgi:hypothetical protein
MKFHVVAGVVGEKRKKRNMQKVNEKPAATTS